MEPIITRNQGATYFDNDRNALQPDRGGYSDNEYEQIIAQKNGQIQLLNEALTSATTALAGVKYAASVSVSNATVAFTNADAVDVTASLTNLATGVARNSVLTATITPAEGYEVTGVTVNNVSVTIAENAFELTLDNNKVIVIATAQVESTQEEAVE